MNFFCTKEHLQEYQCKMNLSAADIFSLDAAAGLRVARQLFSL